MDDSKPQCFVIAPIGADGSLTRKRSDQIFKHILKPVASECGYDAVRADHISEPGTISTQVINHILDDPMVVADLSEHNPNVFYELAVRHAIRKPYVQIIEKGEKIPFDVAGLRTVEIDHTNLDSVASAKEEIKRQMLFARDNPAKIESPISVAVDLEKLKRSADPEKRQMAEILSSLGELKVMIDARLPYVGAQSVPLITTKEDLYKLDKLLRGQSNAITLMDTLRRNRPLAETMGDESDKSTGNENTDSGK